MGGAGGECPADRDLERRWPGRSGLEATGSGSPLVSAAVVLMVCFCALLHRPDHRGGGRDRCARLVAGAGVTAVYLLGLRLVQRQSPKAAEPEPLFHPGGGTLIHAVGLAGFAAITLIYATPIFVETGRLGVPGPPRTCTG